MSIANRESDDLTVINGIGPVRQRWLRESLDVYTLRDLAALSVDEIESRLKAEEQIISGSEIEAWIDQAQELALTAADFDNVQSKPKTQSGKEWKMEARGQRMEERAQQAAVSRELRQRFAQAYYDYARNLVSAWGGQQTQQRITEENSNFLNSLRDIWSPPQVQDQVSGAYQKYLRTLQDPGAPTEASQRLTEAYQGYVEAVQQAWNPTRIQQQSTEAYRSHLRQLGAAIAPQEVQEQMSEAYYGYIRKVQETISQQEPEALDASTLVAIAQSLIAAASLTAAASGALRQRMLSAAYMESAGLSST
ncbi:MAG: hypothetical protein ACYTEQ_05505 [Planctomycetota bacterium]|jgi:hypothetical protein